MTTCKLGFVLSAWGSLLAALSTATVGHAQERAAGTPSEKVVRLRVPNGGIQPQTLVDDKGTVHLIYLAGDPRTADVFYARSADGTHFSQPLRVNSRPGSAIAI